MGHPHRTRQRRPLRKNRPPAAPGEPGQQRLMHRAGHVPQGNRGIGAHQHIARLQRQGLWSGAGSKPVHPLERRRHGLGPQTESRQEKVDHRDPPEEGIEGKVADVDDPPGDRRVRHRHDLGEVRCEPVKLRHQGLGRRLDPCQHHATLDGLQLASREQRLQADDAVSEAYSESVENGGRPHSVSPQSCALRRSAPSTGQVPAMLRLLTGGGCPTFRST